MSVAIKRNILCGCNVLKTNPTKQSVSSSNLRIFQYGRTILYVFRVILELQE